VDGGTLVFPLGVPHPDARGSERRHSAHGAMLRVERQGDAYAVRYLTPVAFVCAEGELAGDEAMQRAVYEAFGAGGIERVASLRRNNVPPERCWLATPGFSLCFDPPPKAG
jgi:protein-L-isoaspartate(D-aspartate) O-methyltransferase